MEQYIMFGGRKVPIATNYAVNIFANDSAPSFYHPEKFLSQDKLDIMNLIRPGATDPGGAKNFSFRAGLNRSPEQLFGTTRQELDALGQHIHQIALHHDVTTNAIDTYNVLCTRGLSTHFVVNYDGALYQFMDCYHVAWATGDNNNHSIAIDMNNPVYPEEMDRDPAKAAGFVRDIFQGNINGSLKTMLGYTNEQYDTLIALIKALITPIEVPGEEPWIPLPLVAANCFPPISESGEVINRLLHDSINFHGFLGHYHCSANKWDPGPAFDWLRVLSGIKGKRNSLPMMIGERGEQRNLADVGGAALDDLLKKYYKNAEEADGGWYPIGANQSWHSGIHLTAEKGTKILNMMEGTIVAVRNVKTVDLGDPSFVLVRHEREEKDKEGKANTIYWYSLFMHLEPMLKEEKLKEIPWVTELFGPNIHVPDSVISAKNAGQAVDYEKGIPQVVDGRVPAKNYDKILEGFFRGDIILTDIPYSAEQPVGTIGRFGKDSDHLHNIVHIEVFSPVNIFDSKNSAQSNAAWSIIEGDSTEYSLVRVKKLLKPIQECVKSSSGRTPTLLKTSDIGNFFSILPNDPLAMRRDSFRKMICYHRSEWSPKMNWTKTAIQSVGWQWESEKSFGEWLLQWLPFQWLTKRVTSVLDLPEDHFFFTYHPIYLLQQLNLTYAGDMSQNAEVENDEDFDTNANKMRERVQQLQELNKKLENKETLTEQEKKLHAQLYEVMDDHMGDNRADIDSQTVYDYYPDERFNKWEPGEWDPPAKADLNKVY